MELLIVNRGRAPRRAYLARQPQSAHGESDRIDHSYQGHLCMPESVVGWGMTMTPDSLVLCIGPVAGMGCVQILAD
jgi:hypothetical protein